MNSTNCNTKILTGTACPQCNDSDLPSAPQHQQKIEQNVLFVRFVFLGGAFLLVVLMLIFYAPDKNNATQEVLYIDLYGKTIDGEDFDWESLRGKYVLVKFTMVQFTSPWHPICQMQIPGMLEVYEKYHPRQGVRYRLGLSFFGATTRSGRSGKGVRGRAKTALDYSYRCSLDNKSSTTAAKNNL